MNKLWSRKYVITAGVLAASLTLGGITAFAGTNKEDFVKPSSLLYKLDRLQETISLNMTKNSEERAKLLMAHAAERLAEVKGLTDQEKAQYLDALMENYLKLMKEAEEKTAEVLADAAIDQTDKEVLASTLQKSSMVEKEVEDKLDDNHKEKITEEQLEMVIVASVVKGLDPAVVEKLREDKFGFGEIAKIAALAKLSGKSIEEIVALRKDGNGYGKLAQELGIHPKDVAGQVKQAKTEAATMATANQVVSAIPATPTPAPVPTTKPAPKPEVQPEKKKDDGDEDKDKGRKDWDDRRDKNDDKNDKNDNKRGDNDQRNDSNKHDDGKNNGHR